MQPEMRKRGSGWDALICEMQPKRPCGNSPEFLRELGLVVHAVVELPFDVDVDGSRRLRVLPGDGRIDANLSVTGP